MVGIQNSTIKKQVNFVINKTIDLPTGFILGTSFITGSVIGSLLNIKLGKKN